MDPPEPERREVARSGWRRSRRKGLKNSACAENRIIGWKPEGDASPRFKYCIWKESPQPPAVGPGGGERFLKEAQITLSAPAANGTPAGRGDARTWQERR